MICFGRDPEIQEIWRRLGRGDNLLMLAPRRIGKTRILNELARTGAEKGYKVVLADVEGFSEEKEFTRELCASIQEELSFGQGFLVKFNERVKSQLGHNASTASDWRQSLLQSKWDGFTNALIAHLDETEESGHWLILLDELPVFVQALGHRTDEETVRAFLYFLRRLRQKYPSVRWVFAGSIGLESVARRSSSEGALNDLHPITIGPFDDATAEAFCTKIASSRNCTLTPQAMNRVRKRLGWLSPYYLERIVEDACAEFDGELTEEIIDLSMDRLLELPKRLYWASWREHLDRNFQFKEAQALHDVLGALSAQDSGLSKDQLLGALNSTGKSISEIELRNITDTLIQDGYIQEENGTLKFRMTLLREWWNRYVRG